MTDHHEEFAPGSTADITVDPCRIDETYVHTGIRGAHVTYQVTEAYTRVHRPEEFREIRLLRLFAGLGTVSDVMPVLHENRRLVRGGISIARLTSTGDPVLGPDAHCDAGLQDRRPLFELARRTEGLKPFGHGFTTTPVVEIAIEPLGPCVDRIGSDPQHPRLVTRSGLSCLWWNVAEEKFDVLQRFVQRAGHTQLGAAPHGDAAAGHLPRRHPRPGRHQRTDHHGCLSPVEEETMTTPPTASRLLGIGWCALVPFAVAAVYLGLGTVAVRLIGEPIVATSVLGMLVVILVGSVRIKRPQWLAHAPAPRPSVEIPRFGWTVVGCAVLAFLAGQSMALWIYATTGSTGFDASNQTRHAAGVLATLLLAMVAAPAGEEALFRGLVYPLLRKRVSILASTLVTAVVFGLLHGNAVQFASTLPLAVLLALLYEHTRVLWPCVLLHLGFNLAAALVPAQVFVALANPVSAALLYLAFAGCAFGLYRRVGGSTAPSAGPPSGSEAAMQ
ncbi:CPBP family intramembrane glutamic endopeptidase [Streptomyces lavendulae]|uniref:CPBP family intramembrane glutamic endopeptidase n=1 Tax=Streptomyces lavendulae TaxID=1914 RepID=UPI0024A486E9|nr:hypothetical protein Sros01_29770 [Streptomyces roseochromogenus]